MVNSQTFKEAIVTITHKHLQEVEGEALFFNSYPEISSMLTPNPEISQLKNTIDICCL